MTQHRQSPRVIAKPSVSPQRVERAGGRQQVDGSVRRFGRREQAPVGLEAPQLGARGGVERVEGARPLAPVVVAHAHIQHVAGQQRVAHGPVCGGEAPELVAGGRVEGIDVLVAVAGGNVLRVVPPLIITQDDVSEAVAILDKALAETREELKNK